MKKHVPSRKILGLFLFVVWVITFSSLAQDTANFSETQMGQYPFRLDDSADVTYPQQLPSAHKRSKRDRKSRTGKQELHDSLYTSDKKPAATGSRLDAVQGDEGCENRTQRERDETRLEADCDAVRLLLWCEKHAM